MPLTDVPQLEESVEIDAAPARVWELVRDPRNMSRWSPQTWRSFLRGGAEVREGSRFLNVNHKGLLVWPTRSKVVRFTPEREIAWRVSDNFTIWSLQLEPAGTGTRLVQRRETPQGISDISVRLTNRVMGGQEQFTRALREGMQQTLQRIKADAER
ncbi:MAG: SRPBCC family protein [Marmoricola sp.]